MRGRGMEQRDPCGTQLWAGIMVNLLCAGRIAPVPVQHTVWCAGTAAVPGSLS